jgi:hypothetical protein
MEGSLVAYKVFTNGSVLNASEINDNLMNQAIAVFSNSAARSAAITSPIEGQLTYLEDTAAYESFDGSSWVSFGASNSGLELIKTQAIGSAVSSVEVTGAFSADYDNYYIYVSGGVGSAGDFIRLQLGSSTASYYNSGILTRWDTSTAIAGMNNGSYWSWVGGTTTDIISFEATITNPFLAKQTLLSSTGILFDSKINTGGVHKSATSYTSFKITPNSGTLTGGTIFVYGYKKA